VTRSESQELRKGAVLYVRVSTEDQATGPFNLSNQEKRCRELCMQRGWPVVGVFVDPGESARSADRPEFKKMLAFCKSHRREVRYVIVQDLSRFARNLQDQAQTMADLLRIEILVRSANEGNVDETASGKLAASLVGGFNEYFSNSLSEKMKDRTRDAVAAGRFPWRAPIGYLNVGGKDGPNIVPDERRGPLVRQAFELMATGLYKKTEVLKKLTSEGLTTSKGQPLSAQTFQAMLRNQLYAGWVRLRGPEAPEPVLGLHVPLVSQETFDRVQAILDGRKPTIVAKRKFNPAFPLKCLVRCEECGTPLTGAFCKGRNKLYPRYWCPNGRCLAVKLSREQLESEFFGLLSRLRPDAETMSKFPKIAAKVWSKKQGDAEKETKRLTARLVEQKRLKHELLKALLNGRISDAEYSEANTEFGVEIGAIEQELGTLGCASAAQDAFVRFAELQLVDLANVWKIASPEQRQKVQNLLFEGGLHYSSVSGILNRSKTSLFSTLEAITDEKVLLVSQDSTTWNNVLTCLRNLDFLRKLYS
jgi:site-specific DNA recombinase